MNKWDVNLTRQFLHHKWQQEQVANLRLWEKAKHDTDMIVAMLIQKYNPRRIYQWGSVLQPEEFGEMSDIDLAIEGIGGAERFFALYGEATALTDFSLDLVEMEKIEPEFAELIRLKGRVIHERP